MRGLHRDEEHASASEGEEDGIFGNLKDELRFVCVGRDGGGEGSHVMVMLAVGAPHYR